MTVTPSDVERGFIVLEADHHRNGVCGESFYVGIIAEADESTKLITWFPEYEPDGEHLLPQQIRIAVLDLDKARTGNIYMHPQPHRAGGNAWRGDHYGEAARAIKAMVDKRQEMEMEALS